MAKRREDDDGDYDPLHVDDLRLDEEWNNHPAEFGKAARRLAEAKDRVAEKKAALELCEAEMQRAVRATPERYGVDKVTEKTIECAVIVSPEYQRAAKAYKDAVYHQNVCQALVDALSHKKAALENRVILWCRDYGSTPKIGREHDRIAHDKARDMESKNRWGRHRGVDES